MSMANGQCSGQVVIVDDDDPGVLAFAEEKVTVKENKPMAVLTVMRRRGRAGTEAFWQKYKPAIRISDKITTNNITSHDGYYNSRQQPCLAKTFLLCELGRRYG